MMSAELRDVAIPLITHELDYQANQESKYNLFIKSQYKNGEIKVNKEDTSLARKHKERINSH